MVRFSVKYGVVKLTCLLSAGLDAVPPGSPMMMSAAQCVLLARSAARASTSGLSCKSASLRLQLPAYSGRRTEKIIKDTRNESLNKID